MTGQELRLGAEWMPFWSLEVGEMEGSGRVWKEVLPDEVLGATDPLQAVSLTLAEVPLPWVKARLLE